MKLTSKTLLLLLLITLVSFSAAVYMRYQHVIPSLASLEAKADRKDVERVLIGFDIVRQRISTMAYNYGVWDDTYQFFEEKQRNKDNSDFLTSNSYLERNYSIETFLSNDIDMVLFVDRWGELQWSRYVDLENEALFPGEFFHAEELAPFAAKSNRAFPGAPISVSGIVDTSKGAVIFASYSVLRSDETGYSPGSILFARHIDNAVAEDVQDTVKIPFTLSDLSAQDKLLFTHTKLSNHQRNSENFFDWYLADMSQQPILRLRLQLDPRAFDDRLFSPPLRVFLAVMLISWILMMLILNHTLVRPIKQIGKHLYYIRSSGDFSARLNSSKHDELGELSSECDLLTQHIEHQNEVVEQQSREMERLSYEDSLTELANRRRFDQLLSDYWTLAIRKQQPLSLLLCDIDFFKKYNDNYGHQSGDVALTKVAGILKSCISRNSDLVARYGGEEFVLILPETNEEGANIVAERLQREIRKAAITHEHSNVNSIITMSIGMATTIPKKGDHHETLLKQADDALYEAKDKGRNRAITYSNVTYKNKPTTAKKPVQEQASSEQG